MLVNTVTPGSMFYVSSGTTPVSVGTALAMAKQYPKTKFTITDSSDNISKNLDALLKIKNNITSISQSSVSDVIVLTATQLVKNASVLGKISTDYQLDVKQVTAENADTVASNSHVASLDILDTSQQIGSNLDALQANIKINTITQMGRTSPIAITADKLVANASVLSKITGFYNLDVSGANVAQALSYATDMKVKSVGILDTSASIATNIDALADLGLRIKEIRTNQSDALQISAAQVKKDAFVIGKIYSNYQLAVVDASAAESVTLGKNKKVVSIDIVDSGVNIVKNLTLLKKLGTDLNSVEISDPDNAVSLTATQWSANEAVVNKFKAGYKLDVTQVGAAYAQAMASNSVVETLSVSDTSNNIASTIDALQANTKLVAVTQTGPTNPLAITAQQLSNNADMLAKLTGSYSLSVSQVAAADAKTLASNSKVVSIAVSDTADGVDANLNDLYALGKKLSSIRLTDTGGTVDMTSAQYFDQTNLLDKITGGFSLAVSGVSAGKAAQVLADGNVATIQIKDTGANLARYLESMQGFGAQVTQIEQTDGTPLTITASQYAANSGALGKFKVAPSFNLTQVNAGSVAALNSTSKILTLAVSDSSSNIAQYLDVLNSSAKVATITQVGTTNPLQITAAQLISDQTALSKIAGTYSLSLANVGAAAATGLAANTKVVSMAISDTGANIASNLDALHALGKKVSSVKQSNAGVAMAITSGQWFNDNAMFTKMVGGYNLQVSAVAAAKAATVLGDGHVSSIQVKDSGSELSARIESLQNLGIQVSEIEQTDTTNLGITEMQFNSASGALSKFKVAPTFDLTQVSAASAQSLKVNDKIISLSVSDNSVNIANQLDNLKANDKLASIKLTGDVTPLVISASQLVSDLTALEKIVGGYNLTLQHVAAEDASRLGANSKVKAMSIDGTAATIAANLDDLVALGKTIVGVKQSDAGTPIEISSAQWSSANTLFAKFDGGYSVRVANVTAAKAVAVLADSHVAAVHIKDSAAHLGANLNLLQALGSQVADIEQSDSTALTITADQLSANATALGKFLVAPTYNIMQAKAVDAASLSARTDVLSVAVSDSSANIAANLDALQSNTELTSIVQTGVAAPLSITAAQLSSDADALGKISGSYSLAISEVAAADAATLSGNSHVSSLAVSDSSTEIAGNFSNLTANAKLSRINLSGASLTMSLTQAQFLSGTSTLAKINGAYELNITGATTAYLDDLDANSHVVSLGVKDTSDNITTTFDQLMAMGPKITGVEVTTHSTEIELTQDQLYSGAATVAKLSGTFDLAVSGVSAENAVAVAGMNHVTGLSVNDTAANIGQFIDALQTIEPSLAFVTLSDEQPIQMTQAQATANSAVIDKILGNFSIDIVA